MDVAGLANVLRLRASVEGQWNGIVPPTDRYVDMSYHARAIATMPAAGA
jgi:hypothetical protein